MKTTTKSTRFAQAIRTMSREWGFTHAREGSHPELITLFAVEACEVCDGEIEAANAIGVVATLADAKLAGLVVGLSFEEGGHCEALGVTTCPGCYTHE